MKKKRLGIIGGGISGMSFAHSIKDKYHVEVFEKESRPGGLIKCDIVDGNLYHMVGGHVFNSRRKEVLDWFWNFFDKEKEFAKSTRNAVAFMGKPIGYPIENHLFQMEPHIIKSVISDLLEIQSQGEVDVTNFEEFLQNRFGTSLYKEYFKPYNEKIWKKDLTKVPLTWLEGKLPMPTVEEIFFNNIKQEKEMNMVHSTFFYPHQNGSQFLADRLSEGLNIHLNTPVEALEKRGDHWLVNGDKNFDKVVFAGNVRYLPEMLEGDLLASFQNGLDALEYHGTTTVLCEIDTNDYSWIYLPDKKYDAHRIICTGNFSKNNNKDGVLSATVEFTDFIENSQIHEQLRRIPFAPKYIKHTYTRYTYPVQDAHTRALIRSIKKETEKNGLYLLGRFAEWEYYNMDAAMGAALDLSRRLK